MLSFDPNLLDLVHDPALVFEPHTEIVLDVNAHACDVYGRTREQFLGLSLREISRDPAIGESRIRETLNDSGARTFQTVQYHRNGEELRLAVRATPVVYQGQTAILSVNRIMATRTPAENEEACGHEAEYKFTLDSLPAAVLLIDNELRILRANERVLAFTSETSLAQIIGRRIEEIGRGELLKGAGQLVRIADESGMPVSGQVDDAAGHQSWNVSVALAPAGGRLRGTVVINDVTTIADLEAEVHRVEALAEFGQVVAGVAHEVRTPLFALATTIEVLEAASRRSDDERIRRRFEMMRAQITRLNSLMHDLLEYGKAPALDVALTTLDHSIAEAILLNAALAKEREVGICKQFSCDMRLLLDEERLITALRNVLENAIQHAPPGSSVTIRGGRAGDRVRCIVEDSGTGFRPQDLASVMEPFFTRRKGGTGLGLAIVRRTVELHGGTVLTENRAEGGARLTIDLPVPNC